ncbi:Carbohydrate sulfotransferase 3 [Mizuhopecten yessoensis]|uniref:Carbohydrate sulfotransferase 3 n=1 Tax=Mizuhopecten yessoensis TaxID=6573 RepID=A0A210R3R1_MIZYE|nr:Carbohydrate sulfotransferase 3 [Mizuhopecten yessoensis]
MAAFNLSRCWFLFLSLTVLVYITVTLQSFGNVYYLWPDFVPRFEIKGNLNLSSLPRPQNQTNEDPTHVLVVTYMRSGSTLIGDILQHYDNSTYAFEPLRYIEEDVKNASSVTFLNGTKRLYDKTDVHFVMADMLYRWFTCDFQKINVQDLTSIMLTYSNAYENYYRCVSSGIERAKVPTIKQRTTSINGCLALLQKPCRTRKVLIIKTIRLEMTSVELLLKWLPGLKVIHLLRDPRGKLLSELKIDEKGWSSIESKASLHCNQMLSDIILASRLHKQYPQNIRTLQYESFSNDPIQKTQIMFNFLNLKFTTQILQHVKSITLHKNVRDDCYWCVKKTNAKLASSLWRFTIQFSRVQQIDRNCVKLYRTVGFRAITDLKSLKNLSIPSQVDTPLRNMSL